MTFLGNTYTLLDLKQLTTFPTMEKCLQFSLHPTTLTNSPLPSVETLQHIKANHLHLICHGKLLYNFARPDVANQIDTLIQEVKLATQLGCPVIIHQGKNVENQRITKLQAINNYVRNVSEVLERTSTTILLLENSAGQGSELGYTLHELSYIYNQFDESLRERIKFCLDTCHIFSAGELDMRHQDHVIQFFQQFDQMIGLDRIGCIHFNDSGVPFGARRDLHGDIGCGYISNPLLGGSPEGLQWIAQWAHKRSQLSPVPLIFETPYLMMERASQTRMVEQWMKDEPSTISITELQQRAAGYYQQKEVHKS